MKTKKSQKENIRKWLTVTAVLALLLPVALAGYSRNTEAKDRAVNSAVYNNEANSDAGQEINGGEDLVVQISDISTTAKFYPITVDGMAMEVVVVQAPDGTIRTAFNTCQVCNGSPWAYFKQVGRTLECQNCGNQFPMNRVGITAGGCNPVPIFNEDKIVTDGFITISYGTLQANAYRFPSNWKQE